MVHTKIYVIECATPNFFYVGSTFRELYDRLDEHECMFGSRWTRRHGFKRLAIWADVPCHMCSVLEDELTEFLMHKYGVHNVRGGNYVNCRPDCYADDWWLPKSLKNSNFGDVPSLHLRPVSKFPLEFRRLVNAFEVFSGLQHANHLDAKPLPDTVLGGRPKQDEQVLPAELVTPALGAEKVPVVCVCSDDGQEAVQRVADGLRKANINGPT